VAGRTIVRVVGQHDGQIRAGYGRESRESGAGCLKSSLGVESVARPTELCNISE